MSKSRSTEKQIRGFLWILIKLISSSPHLGKEPNFDTVWQLACNHLIDNILELPSCERR